jgi:hypothetical protein
VLLAAQAGQSPVLACLDLGLVAAWVVLGPWAWLVCLASWVLVHQAPDQVVGCWPQHWPCLPQVQGCRLQHK